MLVVEITHVVPLVQESLMVTIRFVVSGHQVSYSMLESEGYTEYKNNIHFFDHSVPQTFYAMGVTLAAGYSLNWLKQTFFEHESFDDIVKQASISTIGSNHLLFAPYLSGERTHMEMLL